MHTDTEQRILCLAARTHLDAGDEERLLSLLRGPLDWERLWAQGHRHEVLPLLFMTLRQFQDEVPIPGDWMARAQQSFYTTLLRNTTLADELLGVLATLEDAGVEAMPVKGVVLAETLYGSLALRPAADLDILVRPHDLPAARAALRSLGFAPRAKPTFADLHHSFHDPQYFRQTAGGEVCLELHRALWSPYFFHLETDILWERAIVTQLRGVQVRTLSPEDTLLHLAINRTRSPLRLRLVCDIAELLRRHSATLDWDYVLQQAQVAGARTALFFALMLSQELLGAPLPPTILPRLGISSFKRWLLEQTCGVTALFRPTTPDNLARQLHAILRMLEQDGTGQILRGVGISVVKTGWKRLYRYRTTP